MRRKPSLRAQEAWLAERQSYIAQENSLKPAEDDDSRVPLIRHVDGIFYFLLPDGRTVAILEIDAEYAKSADAALQDDTSLLDRARYLVRERYDYEELQAHLF